MAEELAGVGHWRMEARSRIISWSREVFHVFGLDASRETPPFETLLELLDGEDRVRVSGAFEDLLDHGTPFKLEVSIHRADGQVRQVSSNGAADRAADGRVVMAFGTIIDMTEARLREQALRDSEARYRMLTERATDVIIRYDITGEIEFASPSVRQVGYAPEDLVGRNMAGVHPSGRPGACIREPRDGYRRWRSGARGAT